MHPTGYVSEESDETDVFGGFWEDLGIVDFWRFRGEDIFGIWDFLRVGDWT